MKLRGKRAAVVVFSYFPDDARPRRAAEALVEAGMNVEVICLQYGDQPKRDVFRGFDPAREIKAGIEVVRLPVAHYRSGKFAYLFGYAHFLIAAFILLAFRSLRRRYDLVHIHNMPDILVFSAVIPKLMGARIVLDLHDPMPELMTTIFGLSSESFAVRLLTWLERWSIRFADLVLTPNIAFKRLFSGRAGKHDKIHVIMNSPDEGLFPLQVADCSQKNRREPFVLMYHGTIVERSGLDVAVLAVEKVKNEIPNVELRIYGAETPFLHQVMSVVRERGLEKSVRYCGYSGRPEIQDAIRSCDLGLIPNRRSSFTELNMPVRIFEYLSQGKPVIAPHTSGICDYFRDDELFFFESTAGQLADQIAYIFKNPNVAARVVEQGQRVYLSHRWCLQRERLLKLVTDVCSREIA